ncbi:MAG: hypothetical protein Q9219_004698 [cf. Caloplaca sp. 3 TL-2023]
MSSSSNLPQPAQNLKPLNQTDSPQSHQPLLPELSKDPEAARTFLKLWHKATDDNYFTLFGFRRFRTAHLLALRLLENEIEVLDRQIYQSGIRLGRTPTSGKNLGLSYAKQDACALSVDTVMNEGLISKMRRLLREYDDSLCSFNKVMMMETFALADNNPESLMRNDLNPYEKYKTRLVRVDLAPRNASRDLLRHALRKLLRALWFFFHQGQQSNTSISDPETLQPASNTSYQNTTHLAEILTRILIALLIGALLVIPMTVLSYQKSDRANVIAVSCFTFAFALVVSLLSRASNEQIMAASAAYSAVLVVFVSKK